MNELADVLHDEAQNTRGVVRRRRWPQRRLGELGLLSCPSWGRPSRLFLASRWRLWVGSAAL